MIRASDYKWYTTDHNAHFPYSMAKRDYFTDQEKADIVRQEGNKRTFLSVTALQRKEIVELLGVSQ